MCAIRHLSRSVVQVLPILAYIIVPIPIMLLCACAIEIQMYKYSQQQHNCGTVITIIILTVSVIGARRDAMQLCMLHDDRRLLFCLRYLI